MAENNEKYYYYLVKYANGIEETFGHFTGEVDVYVHRDLVKHARAICQENNTHVYYCEFIHKIPGQRDITVDVTATVLFAVAT